MDSASWDKAKDLIADALELPASEREAYLQAHCADPRVLAEIRDIIRDYTDHSSFLERPPHVSGFDPLDEEDDGLEPGSQIGPYIVIDRIGRGGMGQVYLGSDRRLKRKVALKRLLSSPLGAADERARILREARAAAQINHPNVATIHDVIEHDARVFIVMEYVDGESLSARLRHDRLPIDRVVAIGRQLAAALGAAHAQGVVHRDLKPGNVQLMPDGTVKVLDFGVAKAVASWSPMSRDTTSRGGGQLATRAGMQPGTPEYMSPEQMIGKEVDERSDIFSLGVVLFEMATGRRPYPDDNAVERLNALERPAPRADVVDPRVPSALADVIATALETDVQKRFQFATEVTAALDAVQRELESGALPALLPARSASERLVRAVIIAVVALAVVTLLGVINTAAFNVTLQRKGPLSRFAEEPAYMYAIWGVRSLVPIMFYMILAVIATQALRFVLRVVRLWNPIDRAFVRVVAGARAAAARLRLTDPIAMAQALAAVVMLSIGAFSLAFIDVISAYWNEINITEADRLLPLRPDNETRLELYGQVLDLLMLAFTVALITVRRRMSAEQKRAARGAVIAVAAGVIVLLLLNEFPYRTLWQNRFERVDLAGMRCYAIGESGDESLLYCPDTNPPRNRIVKRGDPAVRRLGVIESIFTPPEKGQL